jgi:hypothetical protein
MASSPRSFPPNLVTLQNGPISTNDPWLPAGATVTTGNNVDAYVDLVTPDGFNGPGDFRATTTAPGVFDRTYDVTLAPGASADQRMAAITELFYINNWLHDWFYDAGFNEAAGNAQTDNYGRGGIGGDSIRAEAQDFSGTNNANMNTPADGGRPRMQMYVFSGAGPFLQGNAPASLARFFPVATAAGFGAQTFTTTADVVWVDDGVVGVGGSIHDGCETPFANAAAVSGKIAFIDRGGPCAGGFAQKFQNAVANGAIGVLIANIATSVNPAVPSRNGRSERGGPDGGRSLPQRRRRRRVPRPAHGRNRQRDHVASQRPPARWHDRHPDRVSRVGPLLDEPPDRQRQRPEQPAGRRDGRGLGRLHRAPPDRAPGGHAQSHQHELQRRVLHGRLRDPGPSCPRDRTSTSASGGCPIRRT